MKRKGFNDLHGIGRSILQPLWFGNFEIDVLGQDIKQFEAILGNAKRLEIVVKFKG